jgi:purine-nucleoside phosphorylase
MMVDLDFKYNELFTYLKNEIPFKPQIALILGSGLGDFVNSIDAVKSFNTSELPGYPPSTITGHAGKIHFGKYARKKLIIFQGRIHLYEGYPLSDCILPVFLSHKLNAKVVLITNAAGGINPNLTPGSLMLVSSFNGISLKKELTGLIGIASEKGKKHFYDCPSFKLNKIIKQAASDQNIPLHEGVYWYTKGPSYETPSEIRMMAKFGGDAVGMSTVHEAVYSGYLGLKTAAVSCITNYAAGISDQKLSHAEVTETANRVKDKFERLIKRTIELI